MARIKQVLLFPSCMPLIVLSGRQLYMKSTRLSLPDPHIRTSLPIGKNFSQAAAQYKKASLQSRGPTLRCRLAGARCSKPPPGQLFTQGVPVEME